MMCKGMWFLVMLWLLGFLAGGVMAQEGPQPSYRLETDQEWLDVAWSPDGALIAAASRTGITIYDAELREVARLTDHSSDVLSVDWSPDGQWLASAGGYGDGTIRIWLRGEDDTFTLDATVATGHEAVYAVSWSPTGEQLAGVGLDWEQGFLGIVGVVHIWNTADWTLDLTLPGPLVDYPFSNEMWYLPFAGNAPATIDYIPGFSRLTTLEWNADGSQLAYGGIASERCEPCWQIALGEVFYFADTSSGEILYWLDGGPDISGITWFAGERLLMTSFSLRVYDTTGTQPVLLNRWELPGENGVYPNGLWHPGGRLIAAVAGSVDIIDTATGVLLAQVGDPYAWWTSADWSPDGDQLAVTNRDRMIAIYDLSALEPSPAPTATPLPTPIAED